MIHKIHCKDESSLFMYAVESNSLAEDEQFHETVELEGTQVKFQLDSGAKTMLFLSRPTAASSVDPYRP